MVIYGVALLSGGLLEDRNDLSEERIALYMPGNLDYVTAFPNLILRPFLPM